MASTDSSRLTPVPPAEPLAPWFGGEKLLAKRIAARIEAIPHTCYAEPFSGMGGVLLLAKRIAARIEAIPHTCYAEPFSGMGGVLLRRRTRSKSEILNDRNGDIVNLFRVAREHPDELMRQFDWCLSSRTEFARLVAVAPETLTDVQRAARFMYLQQMMFGGKPASLASPGTMGPSVHHLSKIRPQRLWRLIDGAHRRLQGVHVECLDWATFIERYDRPFTVFYIDPPYWGHERDYGKDLFARSDFVRMAELLAGLEGRFILSLNDRPEVRELFGGFELEEVRTTYSANARSTRRVGELLIGN